MRNVDCLIISTARAASTSIYNYINQAGELGLPRNKEPHFWCDLEKYADRYPLLDELYVADSERYEALYKNAKLLIDASVGYFFYIDDVISKLCAFGQKPKILYLYREPISRTSSLFNELRKKGVETESSLDDALRSASAREGGLWWERYYDNVAYDRVFQSVSSYSGSVLAVSYHAFARTPEKTMQKILAFMEIEPIHRISYVPMNTSIDAIVSGRLSKWGRFSPWVPRVLKNVVKRLMSSATRLDRKMPSDISKWLPDSIAAYQNFRTSVKENDFYDSKNI